MCIRIHTVTEDWLSDNSHEFWRRPSPVREPENLIKGWFVWICLGLWRNCLVGCIFTLLVLEFKNRKHLLEVQIMSVRNRLSDFVVCQKLFQHRKTKQFQFNRIGVDVIVMYASRCFFISVVSLQLFTNQQLHWYEESGSERRGPTCSKGLQAGTGTLVPVQRGQSLCTRDASYNNWANGRLSSAVIWCWNKPSLLRITVWPLTL